MAANSRDIKRRILSVKNTRQITSAMKMVAASRLRRAQEAVFNARPYTSQIRTTLKNIGVSLRGIRHPLLEEREVKNIGLVVISADKGLCGGYNANIIKTAREYVKKSRSNVTLISAGKRGGSAFKRLNYKILYEIVSLDDNTAFNTAQELSEKLTEFYVNGVVDEVHILYTKFTSAVAYAPEIKRLLPVDTGMHVPKDGEHRKTGNTYYLEPAADEDESDFDSPVMGYLLPKYVLTEVYGAVLESRASEFGARMVAMDSATNNSDDMISTLTLSYNRARQAGITREIIEVSSGAEASK